MHFVSHAFAIGVYFTIFVTIPAIIVLMVSFMLVIAGLITGEAGSPVFLPFMFALTLTYSLIALAFGLLFFALTAGIQSLRGYLTISPWAPVALAFPVIFTLVEAFGVGNVYLSAVISIAFSVYWLAYWGSDAALTWVKNIWRNRAIRTRPISESTARCQEHHNR